jgi:hypothetical protein
MGPWKAYWTKGGLVRSGNTLLSGGFEPNARVIQWQYVVGWYVDEMAGPEYTRTSKESIRERTEGAGFAARPKGAR